MTLFKRTADSTRSRKGSPEGNLLSAKRSHTMNDTIIALLKANDERAALVHQERAESLSASKKSACDAHQRRLQALRVKLEREERAEAVRLKVRDLMQGFCDADRTGGLPADELLVGAVTYAAGLLALMPLDEPAGLKVRRIGRLMQTESLVF